MNNTYWNNKGRFQAQATKLQKRIPTEGPVKGKANAALERFRRASNAYYDIYNNGGGNRPQAIRAIFGIAMSDYKRGGAQEHLLDWEMLYQKTEPVMDALITAAIVEQGLEA